MPLEIEVKFLVRDLPRLRERLTAVGAVLERPRVYERNARYDTPDGALLASAVLLRLRQDTRHTLTYKGEPPELVERSGHARVREEIEFEVSDGAAADLVLRRLGFAPVQVYEKYREAFVVGDVEVVLDELPFGDFVELEGPEADLQPLAEQLGLNWEQRILANYLGLLHGFNTLYGLQIPDLTFAAFAAVPYRLPPLVLEADT